MNELHVHGYQKDIPAFFSWIAVTHFLTETAVFKTLSACIRLRPEHKDHVWSYDFMIDHTADGRAFKILNIIDEYTRECLAILVARKIKNQAVIDLLFQLFILRGIPEHICSDNGPEFTAKAIRKWLTRLGVKTLFIEPGSPWENGYVESFNGKLRDELLDREIFTTLAEARVLIEQ
jgi:putative transposase